MNILTDVSKLLEKNEIPFEFLEKSDDLPLDTIVIPYEDYKSKGDRNIQLNIVQNLDEVLQNSCVMQFFSYIPFSLNTDNIKEVYYLLNQINMNNPANAFSLIEASFQICLRYCVVMPKKITENEIYTILDTLTICDYLLDIMTPYIERVNQGEISAEDALDELTENE